jgi:pimeloyl-ACP methyl ester carboxylesterase
MGDLKDQFRVRAVNLFGYGETLPWPAETIQSLDDQARLVETALPANTDEVYLVGHSFGGSVAMRLRRDWRVASPGWSCLRPIHSICSRNPAASMHSLRPWNCAITSRNLEHLVNGRLRPKNSLIIGGGAGTWHEMSLDRRMAFSEALKPNFLEWDAVMNETTPVEQWATLLPGATLLVCDPRTVLPIREITAVLRRSCPGWAYKDVPGAGHMAPLTRPDLINPLVTAFLGAPANNEGMIEVGGGRVLNHA